MTQTDNNTEIFKSRLNNNAFNITSVTNTKAPKSFFPILTLNQFGGKNNNKTEMTQKNNNMIDIITNSLHSTTLSSNSAKIKVLKSKILTYNKNKTEMFKHSLTSNKFNFNSVANTTAPTSPLQIISSNQIEGKNKKKTKISQNNNNSIAQNINNMS